MTKILLLLLLISAPSLAGAAPGDPPYDDQPQPGEAFSGFFQRITKGGTFRGIRLEAPPAFESAFLGEIKRGTWVGAYNRVEKKLTSQGVDLWFHWFKEESVLPLIAPSPLLRETLREAILAEAGPARPDLERLFASSWTQMTLADREIVLRSLVFRAPLFGGRRLLDFLADEYGTNAAAALELASFRLLNAADFKKSLEEAGYFGPVYFRGITLPDPRSPGHDVVLLNNDLLESQSTFEQPVFRLLESVTILVHEYSHVFQDARARSLGLELSVQSAEGSLLIEGMAEDLAEEAVARAGASMSDPTPVELFARAEGVEVVYRPGNASSGQLFPYTVGLPFAETLRASVAAPGGRAQLRDDMLAVIAGRTTLPEMLKARF